MPARSIRKANGKIAHPFRVGRSRTGFGVFATEPIKKNTYFVEYIGPAAHQQRVRRDPGQPLSVRGQRTLDDRRLAAQERRALHQSFVPAELRPDDPRPPHPHQGDQEHRGGRRDHLRLRQGPLQRLHQAEGLPLRQVPREAAPERAEVRAAMRASASAPSGRDSLPRRKSFHDANATTPAITFG